MKVVRSFAVDADTYFEALLAAVARSCGKLSGCDVAVADVCDGAVFEPDASMGVLTGPAVIEKVRPGCLLAMRYRMEGDDVAMEYRIVPSGSGCEVTLQQVVSGLGAMPRGLKRSAYEFGHLRRMSDQLYAIYEGILDEREGQVKTAPRRPLGAVLAERLAKRFALDEV